MSNFKHIETISGFLSEIRNIDYEGKARSIQVQRQTGLLRPTKNDGRFWVELSIFDR